MPNIETRAARIMGVVRERLHTKGGAYMLCELIDIAAGRWGYDDQTVRWTIDYMMKQGMVRPDDD